MLTGFFVCPFGQTDHHVSLPPPAHRRRRLSLITCHTPQSCKVNGKIWTTNKRMCVCVRGDMHMHAELLLLHLNLINAMQMFGLICATCQLTCGRRQRRQLQQPQKSARAATAAAAIIKMNCAAQCSLKVKVCMRSTWQKKFLNLKIANSSNLKLQKKFDKYLNNF